ncbi:hypothetical protein [Corallibacter sp.]|uniref:hypothetical protein n=1 Tax=Corallibacter sp. TaxID=2038084 RepID=UPI003AB69BA2
MEESLKNQHQKFIERLYKPFIFYIPRRLYTELDPKGNWDDEKFDDVFDTVVLIKEDGSNQALGDNPSNFYIFPKGLVLSKNTYDLFDLKEKLNAYSFRFLLDDYLKSLVFYVRISKWMHDNIRADIKDIREETLFSFEKQMEAIQEHWDYLQENFKKKSPQTSNPLGENIKKEDLKAVNNLIKISNAVETKHSINTKPKPKKTEKKILVTDEEAEKFLLKTVFKVNS